MAGELLQLRRVYFANIALFALIASLPLRASDVLNPGEHFATVNGVRLWYKVAGRGPILIAQAPGWRPASPLLQRYLAPLERSFTVVYYDPRGSGKSSRPAQDTQMSALQMADDLEAFRSYLGLKEIAVLGHSHGSQIAAIFAAKQLMPIRGK
jgi:pimeloyl-ACP methyl ester carboxylesterase